MGLYFEMSEKTLIWLQSPDYQSGGHAIFLKPSLLHVQHLHICNFKRRKKTACANQKMQNAIWFSAIWNLHLAISILRFKLHMQDANCNLAS